MINICLEEKEKERGIEMRKVGKVKQRVSEMGETDVGKEGRNKKRKNEEMKKSRKRSHEKLKTRKYKP